MPKKNKRKKDWQYESFRCIFCNHKGEWVTIYVRADSFMQCVEYLRNRLDLYVIKEVSAKLENGELAGKEVEYADYSTV